MQHVTLEPIAVVVGGRSDPTDDHWGTERCVIELDERFGPDSIVGLAEFSHLDVVYLFHLVDESEVITGARRPRGREEWPAVGIFAQRGRVRPNRLGVTTCRIESVAGRAIEVSGLDAVDGTPVLDLKPHMVGFEARGQVVEPEWATQIMAEYW